MNDPLISRIRIAAVADAPQLSESLLHRKSQGKRVSKVMPNLALAATLLLISGGAIATQAPTSKITTTGVANYGYGPNDTFNAIETFTPDWRLPWFGSEGTAFELRVPGDFTTRLDLLQKQLPNLTITGREFKLISSGHWRYQDVTLSDYVNLTGELPTEERVRQMANKLFIFGGFTGDLSTMTIKNDSLVITATCELLLDGRPSGIGYSATWTKGGKLAFAEGWISNVVRHEKMSLLSPREATGRIKWRDVVGVENFTDYKWDGDPAPQSQEVYTTTKDSTNGLGSEYEIRHYVITGSSPDLAMTRNKLGMVWIVPSYVLASGKTVITNQPALDPDVLDNFISGR